MLCYWNVRRRPNVSERRGDGGGGGGGGRGKGGCELIKLAYLWF